MDYHLDGTEGGDVVRLDYDYNRDNRLNDLTASSYIVGNPSVELFSQNNLIIDGLGRLTQGDESIRNCSQIDITHALAYNYDLLGRLDDATITNINSSTWTGDYNYLKDGNLDNRTINSTPEDFDYTGDLLTTLDTQSINWDDNGNLKQIDDGTTDTYSFNWDNQLREAVVGDTSVWLKYDPDGNRIYKESDDGQTVTKRKYIVGEVGGLPVILLEINPTNSQIVKSYVYAQDDLVTQYDGDQAVGQKYFYVCDRLGNVRQVIDVNASVQYLYTYGPFGKVLESDEDADPPGNVFRFTGQFYDADLDQYHLRARQYSPDLARFTARDPDKGDFHEPFSLHAYLYCLNDPVNQIDPQGESSFSLGGMLAAVSMGLYFANYANAPAPGDYTFADNSGEMVTGMAGCIILAGVGQGVGKIVWPWLKNRIIINRLLGRPGSKILSTNSARGWKVGDPINNLTKSGKVPSWNATRARYWKNRAHFDTKGEFTKQNLERMRKGLAPQRPNPNTGKLESVELHHVLPMREGGRFYFVELWPEEHATLDPYRYLGDD